MFGASIGSRVYIKPRINIHFPWKLKVGNDVWIGENVEIINLEHVVIGNNVCISQNVIICSGNHDYRTAEMFYRNSPIFISDGVWIAAFSFVGPGVSIGVDTVVTAMSFVSKDLNANSVYSGNPCKYIKNRW